MKIQDLLLLAEENPDELIKLTDKELLELLEPYLPETRKAVLPPTTYKKQGLDLQAFNTFMKTDGDKIRKYLGK